MVSSKYSKNDVDVIGASAQRLVDVINESLKIANDSNNPETKLSRLSVAKNKLEDVKGLEARYSFLTITSLKEVENVRYAIHISATGYFIQKREEARG